MAEDEIKEIEKLYRQCGKISDTDLVNQLKHLNLGIEYKDLVNKIIARQCVFNSIQNKKEDFSKFEEIISSEELQSEDFRKLFLEEETKIKIEQSLIKLYPQCGRISHQELFRSLEKLHIDKDNTIVARILARQMAFEYLIKGRIDLSKYYSFIPEGMIFRSGIIDKVYTELMMIKAKNVNNPKYEGKIDFNIDAKQMKRDLETSIRDKLMKIYLQCGIITDFILIKKIKDLGVKPADFNVINVIARQMAANYLMNRTIIFSHFNDVLPAEIQYDNWINTISEEFKKLKKEYLEKTQKGNTTQWQLKRKPRTVKEKMDYQGMLKRHLNRICNTEFDDKKCKDSLIAYIEERGKKKEKSDRVVIREKPNIREERQLTIHFS